MPELRKLHNTMNYELQYWKDEVREARLYHYELNYFTTPQLLTLRKELGYLKSLNARSVSISRQVQCLLQSVVPVIDVPVLLDSLTSVSDEHTSISMEPQQTILKKKEEQESMEKVNENCHDLDSLTPVQKDIFEYIIRLHGSGFKELVLEAFKKGKTEQDEIENMIIDYYENVSSSEDDSSEDDSSGDEADNDSSLHQDGVEEPIKKEFIPHLKRNGMSGNLRYSHTTRATCHGGD